ncbi:MAG: hypothetical protein IKU19_04365, partial [Clostridia bacterium]|nr:hypothetical protein [Clostridia bacterium]
LYASSKESIPKEDRIALGEELLLALKDNVMMNTERYFDEYQGFDIVLPANMNPEKPYICICSANGGKYYPSMDTDKPLGCCMRIDHILDHLSDRARDIKEQMDKAEINKNAVLDDISRGNIYQAKVEKLTAKLNEIDRKLQETEESA